jgi:hypothetical protein
MEGRLYAVFSLAARIVSHTLRRIKAPAAFPSLRGGSCQVVSQLVVEQSRRRKAGCPGKCRHCMSVFLR